MDASSKQQQAAASSSGKQAAPHEDGDGRKKRFQVHPITKTRYENLFWGLANRYMYRVQNHRSSHHQ
jgi:hypothetical protein